MKDDENLPVEKLIQSPSFQAVGKRALNRDWARQMEARRQALDDLAELSKWHEAELAQVTQIWVGNDVQIRT